MLTIMVVSRGSLKGVHGMGTTRTGLFGGLGQAAKLAARGIGFGLLAVLIGIIVGVLTGWKLGLLTFAVIGLVAAYYFFRAVRQQARNFSAVGNVVNDFIGSTSGNFAAAHDDGFPSVFGDGSQRRPSRPTTTPGHPASSTAPSAYSDPSFRGDGTNCEQSASPFEASKDCGTTDTGSSASSDGGSTSI
jgi:hypothetical protein